MRPIKIQAWAKALDQITKWSNTVHHMDHVLVIDSLNFATKAAFAWILQIAGRLTAPKEIQDWGAAQDLVGGIPHEAAIALKSRATCSVPEPHLLSRLRGY